MVKHFALSAITACGIHIHGGAVISYIGQTEDALENAMRNHTVIQHTTLKEMVTCHSCQKTSLFKEYKDEEN